MRYCAKFLAIILATLALTGCWEKVVNKTIFGGNAVVDNSTSTDNSVVNNSTTTSGNTVTEVTPDEEPVVPEEPEEEFLACEEVPFADFDSVGVCVETTVPDQEFEQFQLLELHLDLYEVEVARNAFLNEDGTINRLARVFLDVVQPEDGFLTIGFYSVFGSDDDGDGVLEFILIETPDDTYFCDPDCVPGTENGEPDGSPLSAEDEAEAKSQAQAVYDRFQSSPEDFALTYKDVYRARLLE